MTDTLRLSREIDANRRTVRARFARRKYSDSVQARIG